MEKTMTDIMYRIPSDLTIEKVIITPECIETGKPEIKRSTKPREKIGMK